MAADAPARRKPYPHPGWDPALILPLLRPLALAVAATESHSIQAHKDAALEWFSTKPHRDAAVAPYTIWQRKAAVPVCCSHCRLTSAALIRSFQRTSVAYWTPRTCRVTGAIVAAIPYWALCMNAITGNLAETSMKDRHATQSSALSPRSFRRRVPPIRTAPLICMHAHWPHTKTRNWRCNMSIAIAPAVVTAGQRSRTA